MKIRKIMNVADIDKKEIQGFIRTPLNSAARRRVLLELFHYQEMFMFFRCFIGVKNTHTLISLCIFSYITLDYLVQFDSRIIV